MEVSKIKYQSNIRETVYVTEVLERTFLDYCETGEGVGNTDSCSHERQAHHRVRDSQGASCTEEH